MESSLARDTSLRILVLNPPLPHGGMQQEQHVDKNRTEGTKHEISGAVKEGIGKVTGDRSKQLEGNLEKNTGKVQREVGKVADDVRHAARDDH